MNNSDKGEENKECNRTACSNKPAIYYNHSTRKYYCVQCARMINDVNPESYRIYGHQLCTINLKTI